MKSTRDRPRREVASITETTNQQTRGKMFRTLKNFQSCPFALAAIGALLLRIPRVVRRVYIFYHEWSFALNLHDRIAGKPCEMFHAGRQYGKTAGGNFARVRFIELVVQKIATPSLVRQENSRPLEFPLSMGRDVGAQGRNAAPDDRATFSLGNGICFREMLRLVSCPGRLETCLHELVRDRRPFQGRVRHGFFRLGEQAVSYRNRSSDFFNRLRPDFPTGWFRGCLPVLRRIAFRQHIVASIAAAI
jgi:hypothetical protein